MRSVVAILLFFLASPTLAEVSDKAASQFQLWSQGIVVGLVALLVAFFRPLVGLIIGLAFAILFAYGHFHTFADPNVGVALLSEQGEAYRLASYASFVLASGGAIVGAGIGLRSRTLLGERRAAS